MNWNGEIFFSSFFETYEANMINISENNLLKNRQYNR